MVLFSPAEMDKIYLLQNGTVVESGTHDELMELKGKYYSPRYD